MNRKRLIAWIAMLLFIVIFTCSCSATTKEIPIPEVKQDVYIYDADGVIDDNTEKTLNTMLVEFEEKTSAEFVVISVESLLNKDIENYSNKVFNALGIGKEGKDNGVLLLFSRSDKRVRLEIGRGLEGCLNDSKCGRILDDFFVPYREEDKYTEATYHTVNAVLNVLAEEYEIEINGIEVVEIEEDDDEMSFWEILLLVIVVIIVLAIVVIGSEGGYGSSGGFSGGFGRGSSGGFGGFGGGFSGGGGASR